VSATSATIDGDERLTRLTHLDEMRERLRAGVDAPPAADRAGDAVRAAQRAVGALADIEPAALAELDATELRAWIVGIERVRRMVDAVAVTSAGAVERHNPFRDQGFFTTKTASRHMAGLSGPEAFRRAQTARMHAALPDWAQAHRDGDVGVAQCELMARVVANPRLPADVVQRDAPALLIDAITLPFEEFERQLRTWEALADAEGNRRRNDARRAARNVTLRPRPEGGWHLTGNLPELEGTELNEILAWFSEAEWQADWADARARVGDDATVADLDRSEAQRRADALLAMARAAASTPHGCQPPRPTVDLLIDQATFEAHLRGETRDPADYATVVCRTQRGRRLHPDDVINAALVGHIRRVVLDSSGTVIDLGRRSRLFRGSAREAVMLTLTECVWVGCDRPIDWCDADHSLGWKAHGATVPRNGSGLCPAHNRLKERGFHVFRDADGDWHVTDPNGDPIT
jgi:hypothetical protein